MTIVFEKENRTIIERLVNPKDPLVWIDELQKRMDSFCQIMDIQNPKWQ